MAQTGWFTKIGTLIFLCTASTVEMHQDAACATVPILVDERERTIFSLASSQINSGCREAFAHCNHLNYSSPDNQLSPNSVQQAMASLYLLETCGENIVEWLPGDDRPLYYIEGYHYEKLNTCINNTNFRHGTLEESDVKSWLRFKVSNTC